MRSRTLLVLLWLTTLLVVSLPSRLVLAYDPQYGPTNPEEVPHELDDVGVDEHLGTTIPLDVMLRDEQGREVKVGDYFRAGHPVVINFVYHTCPRLCSMVLAGFTASAKHEDLPWGIGEKYDVLSISIDPRDTSEIAAEQKQVNLQRYGRSLQKAATGWHFLTGDPNEVRRLATAVGFKYRWDPTVQQYAHPAALFVVTPQGRLARYLYGIEFPPLDMRLALAEASEGRMVTTYERFLLYCYHYDPAARSYVLVAMNVMRVAGVLTMLLVGLLLMVLWRREPRARLSGDATDSVARRGPIDLILADGTSANDASGHDPGAEPSLDATTPSPANRGGSLLGVLSR